MSSTTATLRLPKPLAHQRPILDHPARFKLWRAGRRTGKSRCALIGSVVGHGPDRLRKGLLQGGAVAWFAPDYKQAQAIWREELKPRFSGLPGCEVSETEKRVAFPAIGGWLQLLSAENIDAARGWKLDGAVCDEGAYWDLEYGWNAVIRPALADKQGWALFGSTTNAGHDGNAIKRVPSYFNLLCERADRHELGADWQVFHNRTEDNPKIPRAEIQAMRSEYGPDSATAAQELDAELHVLGGRYYQLDSSIHLVPRRALPTTLPSWWEYWAGYDWGYAHWAVAGVFCRTDTGAIFLLDAMWLRRAQDAEQATSVQRLFSDAGVPGGRVADIYAGRDCWNQVTARGASGITTADIFADHGLFLVPADTDRVNGGRAVRRALAASDATRQAGVYLIDTPNTRRVFQQLVELVPDPNDVNKPGKVNADQDGRGGDDGADMFRYGLATRVPAAVEPRVQPIAGPEQDPMALVAWDDDDTRHGPMTALGSGF